MDPIFELLAAHHKLPTGWGFPAPVDRPDSETTPARQLREALFPFNDEEGLAQMVRWYYGVIRSFPEVALGIGGGDEAYDPGLAWKPPIGINSKEVNLTVEPGTGVLEMLWVPGADTKLLTGTLEVSGASLSLVMNGVTYSLPYDTAHNGDLAITWPKFLKTRAALTGLPSKSFAITFRPMSFDAGSILDSATPYVGPAGIAGAGATGAWYAATAEERLAICWAVMKNLRYAK